MSSMSCNKEQLEAYIASLEAVVQGNVAAENLEVIKRDAKRMHEEAGIQLTKDFEEQVEEFIMKEVKDNQKIFEDTLKTARHIYNEAESTGAFQVR